MIVSTSTLELGIDVGDLDRVIQVDAPNTVASFLQRLGRTGRRPGTQCNCLFLATPPSQYLRALKFNDCLPDNVLAEILRARMLGRESIEALLREPVAI